MAYGTELEAWMVEFASKKDVRREKITLITSEQNFKDFFAQTAQEFLLALFSSDGKELIVSSKAVYMLQKLDPAALADIGAGTKELKIHLLPEMIKDADAIDKYEESKKAAEKMAWLWIECETMVA